MNGPDEPDVLRLWEQAQVQIARDILARGATNAVDQCILIAQKRIAVRTAEAILKEQA